MQAWKSWKRLFNEKHLKEHFIEKINKQPSVGLDKVTPHAFQNNLDEDVEIILRKVNNLTYNFTRYKQLLILKGAEKPPRNISIPTVRDKLTISVLNELLNDVYGDKCTVKMPQVIINEISHSIQAYTHFVKIDIKTFFASIDQQLLFNVISSKIHKHEIITLVKKAVQTPSIAIPVQNRNSAIKKTTGIPEGLPISNSLANIFLSDIDYKYSNMPDIKYWRYVDDILLLLNEYNFDKIKNSIVSDITKKKLSINEKKDEGEIEKGFTYLGYIISNDGLSVRDSSVLKFEQSIELLFRKIKSNDNIEYINWKINLKITGFIINRNKYGWIFFFSQITDMNLLFHLDNLVNKFIVRYDLADKVKPKRFVRAYHEIRNALHTTRYVPNIDNWDIDYRKKILSQIYGVNLASLNESQISYRFNKIMSKEIQDIEKDVQEFS